MRQCRRFAVFSAACALLAGISASSQTSIAGMLVRQSSSSVMQAGETVTTQPPASLEAALQASLANAGVAFAGEVLSLAREQGAVVVRWRVDEAVRGVVAGEVFEQKEWPGLSADGSGRYHVGERALVLLNAPSAAGYASPVQDGIVPLHGDAVSGTLDLRWLAQHVVVKDEARLRPMLALRAAGGDARLAAAVLQQAAQLARVPLARDLQELPQAADGRSNGTAVTLAPPGGSGGSDDANGHVDSAMILGMLHAWQRAEAAGQ